MFQHGYSFSQPQTLFLTIHSASQLVNVETFGKQDPYLQFSLDFSDPKSFQRTYTHRNAGQDATWNQSFIVPMQAGSQHLFIEVMDEESLGAPELIGFAAIPLNPVLASGHLNAVFGIFTVDGKSAGEVHLTLATTPQGPHQPQQVVRGHSYVHEDHLKRCKSLRKKAIATDIGAVAVGGALAIGAGLFGKKLFDHHRQHEQEEGRRHEEQERMEQERHRIEEERKHLHQQQHPTPSPYSSPNHHQQPHHAHYCSPWNPTGVYVAGDRVEYQGRHYVCTQGHTSNPTWLPSVAHSLWRPC